MIYYKMQDIKEITGASQSKSYEIIRTLRKQYQKKYPESVSIRGMIPKWYFEEAMGLNEPKKTEMSVTQISQNEFINN